MSKNPSMKELLTEWRKKLVKEAIREEYDTIPVEGSEPIKIYEIQALSEYGKWETHYELEYFCTKENKYIKDETQYANAPYWREEEIKAEAGVLKQKESPEKMSYEEELKSRQTGPSTSGSLKYTTPKHGDGGPLGRREDDWIV